MHAPWTPLVCTIDTPLVYARSQDGAELFKSVTPDEALEKTTAEQAAADPEMMPYFFLQHDDYITLKERTAAHVLAGKAGTPEGIATIDIAIDALKVAEYLTPLLTAALQ